MNFINRRLVKRKYGTIDGYDYREAMAIDVFANRNYAALLNEYLIDKNAENPYYFGVEGETISSALGENILRNTHSKWNQHGDLFGYVTGDRLNRWLDKAFKEKEHCVSARKTYLHKLNNNKNV